MEPIHGWMDTQTKYNNLRKKQDSDIEHGTLKTCQVKQGSYKKTLSASVYRRCLERADSQIKRGDVSRGWGKSRGGGTR